jgi:hypothetical protein
MRMVYRQGSREHAFACDADGGRILGVVARALPGEVAVVCHNGTARRPAKATRDELVTAARVVLARLDADPGLLFRYTVTDEAEAKSTAGHFSRGGGFSGIRFADTPPERSYAVKCGPGHCDLEEIAIGADGRGSVVTITDLRPHPAVETANMGVLKLHRRASKTKLRTELVALLAALEGWVAGPVEKVLDVRGAEADA